MCIGDIWSNGYGSYRVSDIDEFDSVLLARVDGSHSMRVSRYFLETRFNRVLSAEGVFGPVLDYSI